MCTSSTKRRIGRFHVVVVQLVCYKAFLVSSRNAPPRDDTKNGWLWCSGRQRNVLNKSVIALLIRDQLFFDAVVVLVVA